LTVSPRPCPTKLGIKLDEALEIAPPLREMYQSGSETKKLIDLARQLEGVSRNASTHAAGVVISREPLTDLMPLQRATNSDGLMTQYEMHGVEALGLLKFDFLGLSNLTILRQAVDLIRAHRGVEIDLDNLPLEDGKTFELLASGETTGVFQLESPGMRRYIRELRPTSVLDLAAMVALFRPGPMDNIPAYIRRKHGQEQVTYLHPLLEPYLQKTYGIFVYQEDIMAAAMALGGFTGPEADTLGYAIRKKKRDVLQAQKSKFVERAAERGVPPHIIDAVLRRLNRSSATASTRHTPPCYGLIAYQTAYLKANYTVEVHGVCADRRARLVGQGGGGHRRVPAHGHRGAAARRARQRSRFHRRRRRHPLWPAGHQECRLRRHRVDRRGPPGGGQLPLVADFCARIDLRLVNRRVLESLVKVGALNELGHPAQLLDALDDALASGQAVQRDRLTGQVSLFDSTPTRRPWSARCGRTSLPLPPARGCAGRRNCSACTCRTTRWPSMHRRWASSSMPTRPTSARSWTSSGWWSVASSRRRAR
jgi:DNA polymerase-3 subunit alpha